MLECRNPSRMQLCKGGDELVRLQENATLDVVSATFMLSEVLEAVVHAQSIRR